MKQEILDLPKIGAPATRALEAAGYTRLEQLTKVSEAELGRLHGMGPKALGILREALRARKLSFAKAGPGKVDAKKKGLPVSRTDKVDEFMQALDHPFKAEVQVLRDIIKGVDKDIAEEVKWKAPSFNYQGEYLATFNLREEKRIHLVFHNPMIAKVKSELLEGDYVDRRMVYFVNMQDIKSNKSAFEKVLKDLIKLQK
ncbi:MAG TPA: DUF1801 domain-containing protein [Anaerolineales bacterium]|nr:DUF1801 domain-containing protein [Anaerolineales bacterium]